MLQREKIAARADGPDLVQRKVLLIDVDAADWAFAQVSGTNSAGKSLQTRFRLTIEFKNACENVFLEALGYMP